MFIYLFKICIHFKLRLASAIHIVKWVKMFYICHVGGHVDLNFTDRNHFSLQKGLFEVLIIDPLTAKLFNLNFHPLEAVSRWRDPQLQVSENYSGLTKWRLTLFKSWFLMAVDPQHRYSNEAERANYVIYNDFKLKKPFGLHGLYKKILTLSGLDFCID